MRLPPRRRMAYFDASSVVCHRDFGRRKLAPELAPDGKGRTGFSGDESPGKAQETHENRAQRAQEGRGREPLQRFGKPVSTFPDHALGIASQEARPELSCGVGSLQQVPRWNAERRALLRSAAALYSAEVGHTRLSAFHFLFFRSPDGAQRNPGAACERIDRSRISLR
jgi:hypothetical protein